VHAPPQLLLLSPIVLDSYPCPGFIAASKKTNNLWWIYFYTRIPCLFFFFCAGFFSSQSHSKFQISLRVLAGPQPRAGLYLAALFLFSISLLRILIMCLVVPGPMLPSAVLHPSVRYNSTSLLRSMTIIESKQRSPFLLQPHTQKALGRLAIGICGHWVKALSSVFAGFLPDGSQPPECRPPSLHLPIFNLLSLLLSWQTLVGFCLVFFAPCFM
jgi:hypothetical protein